MPNTKSLLRRPTMTLAGCLLIAPLVTMTVLLGAPAALAHEIWIEADVSATAGQEMDFHVYWGHAGNKESGDRLAAQHAKLTAFLHSGEGRETLKLAMGEDGFTAKYTPKTPGYLGLGADLQVGIIDRPVHSIPAIPGS